MLPYLAHGANESIEDGPVLGQRLGAMSAKDQLGDASKLHQHLRQQRGEVIIQETFARRHQNG